MKWLLRVFTPKTRLQAAIGFVFWTLTFQSVYLLAVRAGGLIHTAPVLKHMIIGAMACAPFLLISQGMLWHQMRLQRKLWRMARTDQLTGIANRRRFFEVGEMMLQSGPATLLMIDVDHFKQINDQYGHATGDACLVQFALELSTHDADVAIIARLGGEEFGMLCAGDDILVAQRLGAALADGIQMYIDRETSPVQITASVGISFIAKGEDMSRAMSRADAALYDAKASGRNRAHFADLTAADENTVMAL